MLVKQDQTLIPTFQKNLSNAISCKRGSDFPGSSYVSHSMSQKDKLLIFQEFSCKDFHACTSLRCYIFVASLFSYQSQENSFTIKQKHNKQITKGNWYQSNLKNKIQFSILFFLCFIHMPPLQNFNGILFSFSNFFILILFASTLLFLLDIQHCKLSQFPSSCWNFLWHLVDLQWHVLYFITMIQFFF